MRLSNRRTYSKLTPAERLQVGEICDALFESRVARTKNEAKRAAMEQLSEMGKSITPQTADECWREYLRGGEDEPRTH